jgi:hypothetical protein
MIGRSCQAYRREGLFWNVAGVGGVEKGFAEMTTGAELRHETARTDLLEKFGIDITTLMYKYIPHFSSSGWGWGLGVGVGGCCEGASPLRPYIPRELSYHPTVLYELVRREPTLTFHLCGPTPCTLLFTSLSTLELLCGLVIRFPALHTQRSRVQFPALPDFLSSSGSATGSTQPREDK